MTSSDARVLTDGESAIAKGRKPVFLVLDTCIWLDLAKDYSQRALLGALEELVRMGFVNLIVPEIVLDEFARNREIPDPWTAEREQQLPVELQDWTLVKAQN